MYFSNLVKSQKENMQWMQNSIPTFISSPTNQMSHQATMPFHYLIIFMCNNPNIPYYYSVSFCISIKKFIESLVSHSFLAKMSYLSDLSDLSEYLYKPNLDLLQDAKWFSFEWRSDFECHFYAKQKNVRKKEILNFESRLTSTQNSQNSGAKQSGVVFECRLFGSLLYSHICILQSKKNI